MSNNSNTPPSLINGIFLIAGTSIGAGMLAIPLLTGLAGFLPCIIINLICWLFMFCTGLFFLEATLWMHDGANVLSICRRFLGRPGRLIGGGLFIFLYYCLLVAYFAGGAPILAKVVENLFNISLGTNWCYPLFGLIITSIIFWGSSMTGRINFILSIAMIISYFLLVGAGSSAVKSELLSRNNWNAFFLAAPVLFGAFGYHNIIPTLSTYLHRNATRLRQAIFWGTFIPFLLYTLWQWLIIGAIPPEILSDTLEEGLPATMALQSIANHPWIIIIGQYFSIFALTTSLLGVSLSMTDFFGDGFNIVHRTGYKRLGLCLLTIIPPLIIVYFHPGIFVKALGVAGGIGEAILNGLIPIILVWVGRYYYGLKLTKPIPGGRVTLSILLLFTLGIMGYELKLLLN
ncbi:MAG: amino acid permease [Chlamydiota bacterium]